MGIFSKHINLETGNLSENPLDRQEISNSR